MKSFLFRFAYSLWRKTHPEMLGGIFMPMPDWVRNFLERYPISERVFIYARVLAGTDLSRVAPNELGCAESVSRILAQLGILTEVYTGTWVLNEALRKNPRFVAVPLHAAEAGCIVMAATGEGNGAIKHGHVGILDRNKKIWSNNSRTGRWDNHLSLLFFVSYFGTKGGYPIRVYKIIK